MELRLTMGQLDNKAAADALEKRTRVAGRRTRVGVAAAHRGIEAQGGDGGRFRELRTTKRFTRPGRRTSTASSKETFASVPRDPAARQMEPHRPGRAAGGKRRTHGGRTDGEPLRRLLAEKLMALDLPKRADPLLTRLMRAAPYGPAQAEFGATLATLRLHEAMATARFSR